MHLYSARFPGPVYPRVHEPLRVKEFLLGCSGLGELDLINCTEVIDEEVITHLGPSLTSLRLHDLHDYERPDGPNRRRVLGDNELQLLGTLCPQLQTFATDIACKVTWPCGTFTILGTSFPSLRYLELNTELGYRDWKLQPQLTLTAARDIWSYLTHVYPALRTLDITAGPAIQPEYYWPSYSHTKNEWHGTRRSFKVRPRGDGEPVMVNSVELESVKWLAREEPSMSRYWVNCLNWNREVGKAQAMAEVGSWHTWEDPSAGEEEGDEPEAVGV